MAKPRNSHRPRASSRARVTQYAPMVRTRTSIASGLLNRNIRVATGVRASTAPASRPAAAPNHRFTVAYSTPTQATPISASGTRMLHDDRPNSRTDRPMTHSEAGGLSTVMKLAASLAPKNHAFHDCDPAWAAAE